MAVQTIPPIVQFVRLMFGRSTPNDQLTLLWLIATSCEQELPLAPAVDSLASDARGQWRHRLEDFASLLRRGTAVEQAVEMVPGLLPPDALLAAKAGAATGSSGETFRLAAERQTQQQADANTSSLLGSVFYVCTMIGCLSSLLTYLIWKVIPKFKKIFDDFGQELPSATKSLISAADHPLGPILLIPLAAGAVLLPVLWILWSSGFRYRSLSISRLFPRLDTGPVLQQLGVIVERGKPLTDALYVLSTQHHNTRTWRKLSRVYEGVKAGEECWSVFQQEKLLTARERQLLLSAERTGNLGWALQTLGRQIERNQDNRIYTWLQLVKPVCICILGLVIGFVVVALFVPLIQLTESLA